MGNWSWQRSTDKASGKDAGYAPRNHVYVRADWHFRHDRQLGAQVNHVAGRERAPGDARAPVNDYTTLDLTLRRERGRGNWEYSATVRNLFNADAREPSPGPGLQLPFDLPLAPRALSVQASYQL
jgi:iron complex outermembrane receptor protein